MLLIGLVVWWVIRFLRGTRGASLLKGAAVILVMVYLCIRLLPKERGWEPIEYLYGKFLLFALVAVVVAFQPELRRALAQIGKTRVLGGARRYVDEEIEALADAAGYLARNKIGAIVAIERRVGLGAWMETGTPLNAELTAGLLNTIFHPGTQLHDMGVVVQNGRIAAAACQFPLAESEEVDITFGSRHRAALGLAKETDAIILVVSEQTGRISVAMDGQISVGLDGESLRELLRAALSPEKEGWTRFLHLGRGR
jgi:diadenylate cyclase